MLRIVPNIENGEKLCIRVFLFFFAFVFHAKPGTNTHRAGLSDTSYLSPLS